jgi:hypothetical protein
MDVSPLAPTNNSALASTAPQYSPAFLAADALATQQHGVSQIPQALRYRQWQAINGDALAKLNPKSAAIAYDTALISDPQTAVAMVKQHNNDPAQMFKARSDYIEGLIAKDPAKYAKVAANWRQGNAALGTQLGLIPATATTATQPQNNDRNTIINNIMRVIKNSESSNNYRKTSFAEGRGSTATGAYQFADDTWQEQARKLGGEATRYKRAKDAPPQIQDAVTRNYISNILRNHNDRPEAVFREWYGGPKGYVTAKEIAINNGLTMDNYLAQRMAAYNKVAGSQGSYTAEQGSDGQTIQQTAPEQTPVERTGDALSAGISGAIAGQQQAQNEPELKLATPKPNVPLPSGPIAPDQRELYVKALERISKRNAATPQTQAPIPETPQKPEESTEKAAPQSEDKTQNDSEA